MFRFRFKSVLAAVVCVAAASSLQAILPPPSEGIATKTLRTPGLSPSADLVVADASALAGLGVQQGRAFRDARTGGWGTLILSEPLLSGATDSRQAAAALYGFVADHAAELEIDPAELETEPRVTVHDGGALVQIHARRVISGILVRDTELSAVLNRGNLVLFGLRNWADAPSSVQPAVSSAVAKTALAAHLAPYAPSSYLRAPRLELVPFTNGGALSYRLVWVFTPRFSGSQGGWEGLVDAASGQVLAFRDTNHYAVSQRSVIGAVLPVANDNIEPDGIEQPDFPMPFADLTERGPSARSRPTAAAMRRCAWKGRCSCSSTASTSRWSTPAARRRWCRPPRILSTWASRDIRPPIRTSAPTARSSPRRRARRCQATRAPAGAGSTRSTGSRSRPADGSRTTAGCRISSPPT